MKLKLLSGLILVMILGQFCFALEYRLLKAERAEIIVSDNVTLVGSYYPVKNDNAPGIILLHMLGRNRGDWNVYARHLQKEGIAVLSMDLRGHGESTNFFKIYWRSFWQNDYKKYVPDVQAVYAYFKQRRINPKKIGVMGIGIGANIAINFAASNPDIATVVLVDPGLDYYGIKTLDAIKKYGERPLYIICNNFDFYAVQSARQLQKIAKGKVKLDIYSYEANWPSLFNSQPEIQNAVLLWFRETLLGYKKEEPLEGSTK